jgi:hypothetical protein
MASAATEVLPLIDHKRDSKAIGIAQQYTHKSIKVVNHIKHCLARNTNTHTTCNMLQLTSAPEWARCPLPRSGNMAMLVEYLHTITSAKKRAGHHLDRAHLKQEQEGVNTLVRYSALGSPKEMARFWSKL